MISIESGKDNGYATKSTIIKVTHTIGNSDLIALVRLAKETLRPEDFNQAAGVVYAPDRGDYFCTVEGTPLGTCPHASKASAIAEAERLAVKHGRNVVVTRVEAKVVVRNNPKIEIQFR